MDRIIRKLLVFLLPVIMITSMPFAAFAEDDDFDAFLRDEWKEMMESEYTTMHFAVKDPEKLGLKIPEVSFGEIGYEELAKDVKETQESLDKLHKFDYDKLNSTQQHDYIVFETYAENSIGMYSHPDLIEMFRPDVGTLYHLDNFFNEFSIYKKQDIEDYLTLAADMPRYIDEMIEFTRQQAEKGYFMEDFSLDDELEDIDEFVKKGEECPIIVRFDKCVDKFEGLTDGERADYKARIRKIVLEQVMPAHTKAAEFLETLRGSRSVKGSMYEYPDGKEYYKWLVRSEGSTDESPEEMFKYMNKVSDDLIAYYRDLMATAGDGEEGSIEKADDLKGMLERLRGNLEGFPEGPDIEYEVSEIDAGVAETTLAYYVPAPIDDINQNIIRTNSRSIDPNDTVTVYYTLAHEGFPGHMYQFTWYYSTGCNPIRHELGVSGYEEGWANYVEKIMLDRSGLDYVSAETQTCEEYLDYFLITASDLAVNGMGYDLDKLQKWFTEKGFGDLDAQGIYEYVLSMPGAYLPYGYGGAKFWGLREKTQSALGEDFDLEDFHLQILTNGPRPFQLVEEDLKNYVEAKGHKWPSTFTLFASERTEEMPPAPAASGGFFSIYGYTLAIAAVVILTIILFIWLMKRERARSES